MEGLFPFRCGYHRIGHRRIRVDDRDRIAIERRGVIQHFDQQTVRRPERRLAGPRIFYESANDAGGEGQIECYAAPERDRFMGQQRAQNTGEQFRAG